MIKKFSDQENYKVIAFVMAYFHKDDQQRIIKKVSASCRENRCKVVFFSSLTDFYQCDLNNEGEKRIFDVIDVELFDAVVLMAETFKREVGQTKLIERANAAGVPVITVDRQFRGCINISFDYGDVFREIVKHMVEFHGYRTINFLGGWEGNSFSDERLAAYKEVLEENGIPYDKRRVYYGEFWEGPTRTALQKMIEDELPLPEAIICANDTMAITACSFLKEKGYKVPDDIAISGFDGLDAEQFNRPRLLTGIYDVDEFVCTLFRVINGEVLVPDQNIKAPVYRKMQIGGSCGCKRMESLPAGPELISLKAQLNMLQEYQANMGQMVANYGNAARLSEVLQAVPTYMEFINYNEFWFCTSENLIEEADMGRTLHDREDKKIEEDFAGSFNVLHYKRIEENAEIRYNEQLSSEHILLGKKHILEEKDYVLAVAIHMKGEPAGYAVVSFDFDTFNYTFYANFITHFRFLLEIQKSQMMLMKVYICDSLTGLYNRSGFYQKMKTLMEVAQDMELAIISMDLDHFKTINDTYGHAEGDEALKNFGRIIKDSIRHEIASRVGGDEFLIAFAGNHLSERIAVITATLQNKVEDYNATSGKPYKLLVSIGAYSNQVKNRTLDYFLKKADQLMYEKKNARKKEEKI